MPCDPEPRRRLAQERLSLVDVTDGASRAMLADRIARDLGPPRSVWGLLDWAHAHFQGPGRRSRVLLAEAGGRIRWYLPWAVYRYRLRIAVGPVRFWSAAIVRADTHSLDPFGDTDPEDAHERTLRALSALRRELPRDALLFVESVPERSTLHEALVRSGAAPGGYRALRYGPSYMHRSALIEGGLAPYLQRLGAKTRADLRRTRRRFGAGAHGGLYVATCEADVEPLADAVLEIAPKTWQYRREGAGPRERRALTDKLRAAARAGLLCSYVLEADGRPIAFQVGYVARGAFDAHEIGYDPAWRKHQPGILLHSAIIDDLGSRHPQVTRFDFGLTDRLHKARLSTDAVEEGFYYLLPKTFRGAGLYAALTGSIVLADGIKRVRDRARRWRRPGPAN